jgi:hypothetical protein
MPTSTSIATHASSMTSFSALLTSFEKPSSQFQPKGYNNGNNKVPELALTAVILMTVTLLTFLGYAIFQRCRGKCEYCAAYKDETYALNARNSQSDAQNFQAYASTNAEPDLEKGVTLVDEREKERAATLTALESNSRFKYLWSRAKVRIAGKSKVKEQRTCSNDRFFITVSPVESASATRPPTAQSFNSALERPFPCVSGALEPSLRPASSIYSCAADSNAGRNNYAEHYESTGPIILHAYTTASSNVGRAFSEYIRKDFGPT